MSEDFMRKSVALADGTSLSGARAARELDAIIAAKGESPLMIVNEDGTELTSLASLKWTRERPAKWHYFARGKPQQDGNVESLNETLFLSGGSVFGVAALVQRREARAAA